MLDSVIFVGWKIEGIRQYLDDNGQSCWKTWQKIVFIVLEPSATEHMLHVPEKSWGGGRVISNNAFILVYFLEQHPDLHINHQVARPLLLCKWHDFYSHMSRIPIVNPIAYIYSIHFVKFGKPWSPKSNKEACMHPENKMSMNGTGTSIAYLR